MYVFEKERNSYLKGRCLLFTFLVKLSLCRDTAKCWHRSIKSNNSFLVFYVFFVNLWMPRTWSKKVWAAKKVHCVTVCDCFFKWRSWRVTELHGVLQPAGERWIVIRNVKNRSAIKWHRLAHFNQMSGWIGWYHAVTHPVASPDPYFTKPGYLYWRVLCGFVMRIPFPWCAF